MGTKMLEIIELAKQSDLMADGEMWFSPTYGNSDVHITDLERFAKLVAAKEREIWERRVARLQNLMDLREQQPNKPCCIAEREACAKLCDELVSDENTIEYANGAYRCSVRIRERGEV